MRDTRLAHLLQLQHMEYSPNHRLRRSALPALGLAAEAVAEV